MTHAPRAQDQVRRMLEQTLIPSPHVFELDPDPLSRAASRFADARGTVAEQAHTAGRITRHGIARAVTDPDTASFIRQWYFQTGADGAAELLRLGSQQIRPIEALPQPLSAILDRYADFGPALTPLFGCDIVIADGSGLWKLVGGTGHLTFEGRFGARDAEAVASALESWPPDADPADALFVFVVGVFARTAHLASHRGHRHAYIQAGRIAGQAETTWAGLRRPDEMLVVTDMFIDVDIDHILRNDGVERATVAVLAVCPLPATEGDLS